MTTHTDNKKEICGVIVKSGTGKIDGHACFNQKPCPIHSPSPDERIKDMGGDWEKEFDDLFLGCDTLGCLSTVCSKHQLKTSVSGQLPAKLKDFIRQKLSENTRMVRESDLKAIENILKVEHFSPIASDEYKNAFRQGRNLIGDLIVNHLKSHLSTPLPEENK